MSTHHFSIIAPRTNYSIFSIFLFFLFLILIINSMTETLSTLTKSLIADNKNKLNFLFFILCELCSLLKIIWTNISYQHYILIHQMINKHWNFLNVERKQRKSNSIVKNYDWHWDWAKIHNKKFHRFEIFQLKIEMIVKNGVE